MKDEEQKQDVDPDSAGDAADVTEGQASESGGDPEVALAELREEVAQYRDAALRAAAEAENVRRRAERDVESAHKFALERFAGQLLPVADSLEKSVETAAGSNGDEASLEALREGVELSHRLFLDTLAKVGIEQVDPEGEPFDPQFHEAMSVVESDTMEPNSVVHVLQKGYTLNGRLLRAAMVTVAKAPADAS